MMSRPSQALPEGCPKKVSPLGAWIFDKAAEMPPVSEFESPKLYIAGKSHLSTPPPPTANAGCFTKLTINSTNTQDSLIESMVFVATLSCQKVCTNILLCFHFTMRTRLRGRFCCFLFYFFGNLQSLSLLSWFTLS